MSGAVRLPARRTQRRRTSRCMAGLRREVLENWEESSNDALTFRLALGYL